MDRNRLIGKEGRLPWHLPGDLRHFKHTTLGKPLIMGRITFESIGQALPGRRNIVLTRDEGYVAPGCLMAGAMEDALRIAGQVEEAMIIGGATLFEQALPTTDRIYLTCIDAEFEGDTWFPPIEKNEWALREITHHKADDGNGFPYSISILERLKP